MWGDAEDMGPTTTGGSDTFVFIDDFGENFIYDFDQAEDDLLEFQVAGVSYNFV